MNTYKYIIILFLALCFACQSEEDDILQPIDHVLLVYIAGDNNLSDESVLKVEAITRAWNPDSSGRLLIYHDSADDTPSLVEVISRNGKNVRKTIAVYDEENSASKETLARTILQMKKMYSAQSYGLLIFSHASGWLPQNTLNKPKSVIVDGNDEMEIADFADVIPDGTFDYIIFEACYMAGVEVVYELKDKTKYILASSAEIVSPGYTEVYSEAIKYLYNGSLSQFAETIFEYFDSRQGYMKSATLSVIDTSGLEKLADWIKVNCDIRRQTGIVGIQYFDRTSYHLFFDFEDYYSRLVDVDKHEELQKLIDACVIWKSSTPFFMYGYNGYAINKYSGLTTYIHQDLYPVINESHKESNWHKHITR